MQNQYLAAVRYIKQTASALRHRPVFDLTIIRVDSSEVVTSHGSGFAFGTDQARVGRDDLPKTGSTQDELGPGLPASKIDLPGVASKICRLGIG